ncbi:MAG TPA: hypothetical protein H9766_06395 [Candidatus Dorea faecigallinarum]|nr:hypothetical protein [Candidatus Dorea faecigallinarum]
MEELKQELEQLFDEMIHKIQLFKKKTYSPAFLEAYHDHRDLFSRISAACSGEEAIPSSELAEVIPEYAYQKMQKFSRRDREKFALNFNLTMVAYIVPLFMYTRDPVCEKLAEDMTLSWNQKQVTKMEIRVSTYEKIAAGFKKSWFSFGRSSDK